MFATLVAAEQYAAWQRACEGRKRRRCAAEQRSACATLEQMCFELVCDVLDAHCEALLSANRAARVPTPLEQHDMPVFVERPPRAA